ncbi:MAG: glycosyltransferase family 2 protein, partial [Alphaproteobacteria bacterium]
MPCLNEARTLGACVRAARGYLAARGLAGEVLVADNGSSDGSPDIARTCGARVIHVDARGYGHAVRSGIAAARGRFVIVGDADGSYDFAALDLFIEKLRAGYHLVMGNRFQGGIESGAMPFLHRYLGNPVLSGLGRLFFHSPVGDFHCGLRGFDRAAIQALGLAAGGMELASEMVVKATLHKLRITEVPTTLAPDGRAGQSHLRRWRDGWRHLRFLLLFSPRWLFLYPGLALMAAGLGVIAWLLPTPRQIGGVILDVTALTYGAAALICGFQAMVFAVFTKVYAINAGLLPEDPRIAALARIFRLEIGLVVGAALLIAGIVGSLFVAGAWEAASFSALDPSRSLRIAVPSVTALTLGLETILFSFFFAILELAHPAPRLS